MAKEKFETSIQKLEKIVEKLESGDLSLDEMLKKYEEGVKLSIQCHKTLNTADKKVQVLVEKMQNEFELEDLEDEEEYDDEEVD